MDKDIEKFWQKQTDKPLFPDILWNKPEQRTHAGRLGIIGGNRLGFFAVAKSAEAAYQNGVGEVRVLLPDALRNNLKNLKNCEIAFAPSTESGSFAKDAILDAQALGDWSDLLLIVGDLSRNSETAIFVEKVLIENPTKPILLTRDAAELSLPSATAWLQNPNLTFFSPLAGLQKLFRAIYYPKVITFSMPIMTLIETLHKFTISYPTSIITVHQQVGQEPYFLVAKDGKIITMSIRYAKQSIISPWLGDLSAKISNFLIWNPTHQLEAITTALLP
ncbi:MAG: hypothetical protein LBM97_02025 [Candidatus Nomurabacteria bacterium]|jgi:hypothetical protein|nr:hypothetical protein [Candidatus Nomurabacteria bacterium]